MADHAPQTHPQENGHPREHPPPHREPEEYSRPSSMTPTTRMVIGLLSFVPLVLLVVLLAQIPAATGDPVATGEAAEATGAPYGVVLVMAMLIFFFAAYVFNDRRISIRAKRLWLAGFILGGPIVIPLYWYLHVLRAPRHSAST